jgi:hypothetical protein
MEGGRSCLLSDRACAAAAAAAVGAPGLRRCRRAVTSIIALMSSLDSVVLSNPLGSSVGSEARGEDG